MTRSSFFTAEPAPHGRERFFATEMTRGPWSNEHQHGGPPAGLLLRSIEAHGSEEERAAMLTARITVDFLRPVPIASPLEIRVEEVSMGRRVHRLRATLLAEERELAVASALRIRQSPNAVDVTRHPERELRPPEECRPMTFDFFRHEVGYHTAVELLVADGEFGRGRLAVWMRPRVALIHGEAMTVTERIAICADAGHGIGAALRPQKYNFVNPDMTVYLHRLPRGEWLGMDARTWTGDQSLGLCRTHLLDRDGGVGEVLQSQVISRS